MTFARSRLPQNKAAAPLRSIQQNRALADLPYRPSRFLPLSKGKSIAAGQQQLAAVKDVIAGSGVDQPPRPGAELQISHGFQDAPRQRGADHRRRDRDYGQSGVKRGGLVDDGAEIDQLDE